MPATRAQLQRVQQQRHANLPDEIVRHILDLAGPYCLVIKGGQACTLEIPRTAGRTVKSILAPVSNNLIRVPADHETLHAAVAAARDGCTILVDHHYLTDDYMSANDTAPIKVPPFRLQIVGDVARDVRYGTERLPRDRLGSPSPHVFTPYIGGSYDGSLAEPLGGDFYGIFWVEGEGARLTLRNITFLGVSENFDAVVADEPVDTGAFDSGILATQGARVFIESCWFSGFGRYGIQAQDGAHVQARDCTFNRGYFGVVSDGARVELERVDFQGANTYACSVRNSGSMDLRSCRIREAQRAGLKVHGEGSRLRFDATTEFTSRRRIEEDVPGIDSVPVWVRRAVAIEHGSLTFPDKMRGVYDSADWRWPAALPQNSEGAGDWDDRLDECRWVTVCEDIWHTGAETSMHD